MEKQNLCSLKIMLVQLARFINIVQAEQALRQAAVELWPSGHKQIPRDYIYSTSNNILSPFWGVKTVFFYRVGCARFISNYPGAAEQSAPLDP